MFRRRWRLMCVFHSFQVYTFTQPYRLLTCLAILCTLNLPGCLLKSEADPLASSPFISNSCGYLTQYFGLDAGWPLTDKSVLTILQRLWHPDL
ncbi:hypothetical protein GE21DRAFT_1030342 [Neurospora crassa]|nr:hypothetical protein GE21DRAFT_1030342 [Neurospora crassa]